MTVNEFIRETNKYYEKNYIEIEGMTNPDGTPAHYLSEWLVRPHARCKDGYELSIQASGRHYSNPRDFPFYIEKYASMDEEVTKDPKWKEKLVYYNQFEVSPSDDVHIPEWDEKYQYETWNSYDGDRLSVLYCYVSIEDVQKLVDEHGGIVEIVEGTIV